MLHLKRMLHVATWGSILFDRHSNFTAAHRGTIDSWLVSAWKNAAREQILPQAEAYAGLVTRYHYKETLLNRPSLWFVDNEAARYSLIKGASPSLSTFVLIREISMIDAEQPTGAWYERVPSASNIADLPSRGDHMRACEIVNGVAKGDIRLNSCMYDRLKATSFEDLPAR